MARIYLKPAPDRVVPDPATAQALPAEGAWVTPGNYWDRRLTEKDVVDDTEAQLKREEAEAAAAATAAKKASAQAAKSTSTEA